MAAFRKPTLDDVARAAGVSTATVSRCLNSPEMVVEPTRLRVLKWVEDMGYAPNFGGRALASNRTFTVGAVIPTMENAIFARGIQAFQEELTARGFTLLIASYGYDYEREDRQVRSLIARGADGLLLIGTAHLSATIETLKRLRVPYVQAWSIGDPDAPCVGFDNAESARRLAERVIALGHRRLAMIAGITDMNDRAMRRVDGVRQAVREAGLDDRALRVIEAPYTFEDAGAAFDTAWDGKPRPTAIICGNDVLAVGAITRAKQRGARVPADVSITGFDDIDIASIIDPPLTTVHVPHRRMGKAAAEQLVRLIAGEPADMTVEIDTRIVERGSVGPAPQ